MKIRRKYIDPNRKAHKIYGDCLSHPLNDCTCYIQESTMPINYLLWHQGGFWHGDFYISIFNMRYVEFNDPINVSTVPFKKSK